MSSYEIFITSVFSAVVAIWIYVRFGQPEVVAKAVRQALEECRIEKTKDTKRR